MAPPIKEPMTWPTSETTTTTALVLPRAPWISGSEALRQVLLGRRRMRVSAPQRLFELQLPPPGGRPGASNSGHWRSGRLGDQPDGRRSEMVGAHSAFRTEWATVVCALRAPKRRVSRSLGERPKGSALTPGPCHPGSSREGSHCDPLLARTCPIVPLPQDHAAGSTVRGAASLGAGPEPPPGVWRAG